MGQAKKLALFTPHHRQRVSVVNGDEPSMTKQYFKEETDINKIVGLYIDTGQFHNAQTQPANYGEVPAIDFKTALDLVKASREEFQNMSPEYQKLFDNNSDNYFQFLSDFADGKFDIGEDNLTGGQPVELDAGDEPSAEPSETSKNGDSGA